MWDGDRGVRESHRVLERVAQRRVLRPERLHAPAGHRLRQRRRRCPACDVVGHRGAPQLAAGCLQRGLDDGEAGAELVRTPRPDRLRHPVRRGNPVEVRPRDGLTPRLPHAAVALVAGPGGGTFAPEAVAGVEAPQATEVTDPGGVVVDEVGVPLLVLAGADRQAVPAAVVDVGDADAEAGLLAPEQPGELPVRVLQPVRELGAHGDEVLPGKVRPGVRARAHVHHGMLADEGEIRIVPPAAQVCPHLVVAGERHPGRPGIGGVREEDCHLLPVRLVVVDPAVGGAPVVHRVEEPVLQGHVPGIAHHPAVPGGAAGRVGGPGLLRRRRRPPAGHAAPHEEAQLHEDGDEPGEQPHGGRPGDGPEGVATALAEPLPVGAPPHPARHVAQ